jgi:adenosylcobinamide-GDP ribazoletransferase
MIDKPTSVPAAPSPLTGWRALVRDGAQMVRFYSRLPLPKLPFETDQHAMPDFRTAPRMLPIAGLIIGLPGAVMLVLAGMVGVPATLSAGLAITVSVLAAGAFHEDGIADTFDGLGGGVTPERRLEIMKDSRVGAFGAAALILSIGLRWSAIAALMPLLGATGTALMLVGAAGLSRTIGLVPLLLLPPARRDGFSAQVGRPTVATFLIALGLAMACNLALAALAGALSAGVVLGALLAIAAALLLTWWSLRTINGQTGDIAGAAQQLGEIAFFTGVLISLSHG